jgi:glycosyltransferase involved in cell wall biosynthesis
MTPVASDISMGISAEISGKKGMLKVLMVGALPLDLTQVKGGVEAVIMNLFAGFSQFPDVRVTHVAFTKEVKTPTTRQLFNNVTIHFLPFAVAFELVDYFYNTNELNRIIEEEKPDLIHIQEITPQIIRFINFPKNNIIVTQHGIMREELKYAAGVGQKLKCTFKAYVEKYIFPVFRHVIFISRYNQHLYPKKTIHGIQIYNPVNPIFFNDHVRQDYSVNSIIYVGVLSRRKNIKIVIEALGELRRSGKNFILHVVGGFKDQGYEAEVLGLIKSEELSDNVIFHGWKSQDEVRAIYENCPIFVLPSQQETLPVSIGEAMALGKIVIASDVGAVSEMFTDQRSGFLFRKNDKQDLVRVLRVVHDLQDREALAERARLEAADKFHPTLIAEKTIRFYREVLLSQKAQITT